MKQHAHQEAIRQTLDLYRKENVLVRLYVRLRLLIIPLAELQPYLQSLTGKVLSLGCGYGVFEHYLRYLNQRISIEGIDIDQRRIDIANRVRPEEGRMNFICSDVASLALSQKYDVVIMLDLLHHISPIIQDRLLERSYQLLNNGGTLLIKDIDQRPRWKYYWNLIHDSLMTRFSPLAYIDYYKLLPFLGELGFRSRAIPLNTHQPYPHILVVGTK